MSPFILTIFTPEDGSLRSGRPMNHASGSTAEFEVRVYGDYELSV